MLCWLLGVLVAIPSGAGVALSVLGGNAGSLVGETIHLIYIRFLTDLAAPKELQYTTKKQRRNWFELSLSVPHYFSLQVKDGDGCKRKAVCTVTFRQLEGNGRKFSHIEHRVIN